MKNPLTETALVTAITTLGWKTNHTLIKGRKLGNWMIWWLLCIGALGLFFLGSHCINKIGCQKMEVIQ